MAYTLDSYVKNTAQIRLLSSPQLKDVKNAEDYRALLHDNFVKIGELSLVNRTILDEQVYPVLKSNERISTERIEELDSFAEKLLDEDELENLDPNILLMIIEKLLEDAVENRDDDTIVRLLDEKIMACYTMLNTVRRITIHPEMADTFRNGGGKAADLLFTYLDKEKFSKLSDDSKATVLINARYFCVLYEGAVGNDEDNALIMERLLRAIRLSEDKFYRDALPDYDWDYHNLRALEYLGMLLENHNLRRMSKVQAEQIAKLQEDMLVLFESEEAKFSQMMIKGEIILNLLRAQFEAGMMTIEDYAGKLLELYGSRSREEFNVREAFLHLTAPLEYILLLDHRQITERQSRQLADIYHNTITFLHRSQDTGALSFQLEYAFAILEHFIEIPGVITFEEMCLNCLAALHPPTYVHTMMVGELTRCMCRHLLNLEPELFSDLKSSFGLADDEVLDFAWHAAVCHDFGKLAIIDTIMIYGRRILDEEFALIKQHPDMGYMMLSKHPSTRKYARVARGHHRWHDNTKGYPESFSTVELPERVIIDIVTCADCLDASTDTVGRSYNTGKTVEEFRGELRDGSGTRYAPYLAKLLSRPEVADDLAYLLEQARAENYMDTYILLHGVQEKKETEETMKKI